MIDARIVVIRPAQQHDAQLVFAFEHFEHFTAGSAQRHVVEYVERLVGLAHRPGVLFRR